MHPAKSNIDTTQCGPPHTGMHKGERGVGGGGGVWKEWKIGIRGQ